MLRSSWIHACARSAVLATAIGWQAATVARAQGQRLDATGTGWDVTQPRGATREIDFTTSEGTWTSLDLAPDGRWIVFDLLAHVYRMPAGGGTAECLTQNSGVAENIEPRISPDGRTIAFISDRGGQNNLWLMDADGGHPRPVFTDVNVRVSQPAWAPDGRFIFVVRQRMGGGGTAQDNGIWMYAVSGGTGMPVVAGGPGVPRQAEWPSPSRDGRYLYFFGDAFQQTVSGPNDVVQGSKQLYRQDRRSGEITEVTAGVAVQQHQGSSGGAVAPEVSPDGRWLAFARRIPDGTIVYKGHEYGPRTALWMRDLQTGAERVVMDPIDLDMAEGTKVLRVLPAYAWASDGKSIVIPQGGKIRRLDLATGDVATIPYTAHVHRTISEMAYSRVPLTDGPFQPKFLRWHTASPDGRRLAFQAVGHVWVMDLPNGTPHRVTPPGFPGLEYAPSWSPDGRWLAFTNYDDENLGHVWKVAASGGAPVRLTDEPGEYLNPTWSPDGQTIVFVRGSGASNRHRTVSNNLWYELLRVPAGGGPATFIVTVARPYNGGRPLMPRRPIVEPSYGPNGDVCYPETKGPTETAGRGGVGGEPEHTELICIRPDGSHRDVLLTFPFADEVAVSPDGRWVGYQEGDNVFLVPLPAEGTGGEPARIERGRGAALPVTTLTRRGGTFPHWRDAHTLEYGNANTYYTYDVTTGRADTTVVRFTVPRDIARGTIALTNARLITMNHRAVIERGTIVVRDGRIACVGSCATSGADRVIDARGKTIVPGFIDMHAHDDREHEDILPTKNWEAAIDLAYGVTTRLDPSMWSSIVFPTAELVEAGITRGPRTFSTGDPLYAGNEARQNDLTSYEVARENVERLASWGAITMKQYLQPRRDQRQWISDIARKDSLRVTAEGGDLAYDLGMVMDGQTGWEHPLSYAPIYSDVARFVGQAHAVYSPTLIVAGPSAWNEEYWYQQSDVWKDPKLQRWTPWRMLIPGTRHRMLRPVTDYSYPILAQGAADIVAQGGYVSIGSHGQQHGMGPHWEIWMEASAMGPMGALETATIFPAHFLGMDQDIGSLEVGKLADLVVLNANPLDDIRHTKDIQDVMKAGVLYDGETLDEIWPRRSPYGNHFWYDSTAFRSDKRGIDFWDHPVKH